MSGTKLEPTQQEVIGRDVELNQNPLNVDTNYYTRIKQAQTLASHYKSE